ncbi:branched-chain amino acid transport system II carrier protein, partial [Staphylococcus aureus]|nr:branched-chain amino acid transport system II carrier protein [Staphylococcus aureus]
EGSIGQASGEYAQTPLVSGILQGYFTMDLVAALAFSVVIVQMFKLNGVDTQTTLVKHVIKAGLISAILLLVIYFALAYVGATTSHPGFKDG